MRPRIFSLMLASFGMVIVLGIGGMLAVFGLAVLSFQRGHESWGPPPELAARAEARRLAEYYRRAGSWDGVEPRLGELAGELRDDRWRSVTLVDAEGRVVSSSRPGLSAGEPLPPLPPSPPDRPGIPGRIPGDSGESVLPDELTVQTVPVQLQGEHVGSLVLVYAGRSPQTFGVGNLARSVAAAGLALAAILLGLAALFSGRISTPLRQLNGAAMAMASGDLAVRVRPGLVREVADLAVSFNRMADTLERADQQRRQMTADVAHELRTPLSIIKGRLEGVQDGIYTPDAEQIDGLLGEVALLERLIEDLRILALADAGQLALYPEPTDPAQLLRETARSFAGEAAERGVALRAEPADGLPELSVDPQRIAQVLGNLVGNALRHTPTGGQVALRARLRGAGEIVFSVSDTGAGIGPEDLPHIFDRFYRADRSRTRSSGGAGLGLAITRRIVEAHGGRAWAESELGHGTTVSFVLPVEP